MFLGLDIISNITDWIYANWTVVLNCYSYDYRWSPRLVCIILFD